MATPFPKEGCRHLHHQLADSPAEPRTPERAGASRVPGAIAGDAPLMLGAVAPSLT